MYFHVPDGDCQHNYDHSDEHHRDENTAHHVHSFAGNIYTEQNILIIVLHTRYYYYYNNVRNVYQNRVGFFRFRTIC